MKRKISFVLLTAGLLCLGLASWQIYQSSKLQSVTLEDAKDQIRTSPETKMDEGTKVKDPDIIGILKLPSIQQEMPIVKGVSDEDLEKGVGHYDGTALPGENDQIVLSGHRDTVFKQLGKVKVGDEVTIEMPSGDHTYIIEETFIVEADDLTVIVPSAPLEKLTLTTCYPFHFVGDAPQRFIVNAIRKS